MNQRYVTLLFLLALACAPRIEPVAVEFKGLELEGFDKAKLELGIYNPNRIAVDIEGLVYSLVLDRDTIALGARTEPVRVLAQDTTRAEFPFEVRLELDGIFNRVGAILDDTLRLAIDGRYRLKTAFGPGRRPFRYRRDIPVRPEVDKLLGPLKALFKGD